MNLIASLVSDAVMNDLVNAIVAFILGLFSLVGLGA